MCTGSTLSQLRFTDIEKIRSNLPEGFCETCKSPCYSPDFFLHPKWHHSLSPLTSPSPVKCLSLSLWIRMLAGTSFNLVWNTNLFIQGRYAWLKNRRWDCRRSWNAPGSTSSECMMHSPTAAFPWPEMYICWGSQILLPLGTASMSCWLGSVDIFIILQFSPVAERSRTYYYQKRLSTVLRFEPLFLKCLIILPFLFPAKESFNLKMERKWGWLEAKWFWRVIVYPCCTWNRISINFW